MKRAALLLALILAAAPARASIDPGAFKDLAFRQHPGAQMPMDAMLVDSSGKQLPLSTALAGRPSIFVLEYLRCSNLCSLVLRGAVQSIAASGLRPGRDVDLVALSIDPRDTSRDAAAAQAKYADRLGGGGVHFFTAQPGEVRAVASAIGFPYRYDKASDQFAHPAGFVVTTPGGRISRYVLGLNPDPKMIREAVAEAALEKVEPPAHPLLCLCFGYDPDEGSVAALTMTLVRWTSGALALACAVLIVFLSRRRRPA